MKIGKHLITGISFQGNQVIFTFGENSTAEFTPPTNAIRLIPMDQKEYIHINGIGEITAHVHSQTYNSISNFATEAKSLPE